MITYDVTDSELLTHDVTRILLRAPSSEAISYQAGQYIKVVHRDGSLSPLSIACAPNDFSTIELHLAHPKNNHDAHHILQMVSSEKKLTLCGPYGHCTHSKILGDGKQPIIFLARGTGFAPIKSMIEEFKRSKLFPPIYLYWSATTPEELYLHDLAKSWSMKWGHFSYTPVLSRPHQDWQEDVGLLQHIILHNHPNLMNYQVYASAPEFIVHEAWRGFSRAGLKKEHYFSDVFDYVPVY